MKRLPAELIGVVTTQLPCHAHVLGLWPGKSWKLFVCPGARQQTVAEADSNSMRWRKQPEQMALPIGEDALDITSDEQPVHQPPTARTIPYVVTTERSVVALFEGVRVMPERVGTTNLDIDETMRWIPFRDFRAPADG